MSRMSCSLMHKVTGLIAKQLACSSSRACVKTRKCRKGNANRSLNVIRA
jgi:hypothetical protein